MTTITGTTTQERLERAFETLKKRNITPILVRTGSTGVIEQNLANYKTLARAAGTPEDWVGAHAGAEETSGAHWVDGGRLCHRATGHPVRVLWFSFPLGRRDIAEALVNALTEQGFSSHWMHYDADGLPQGPGTDADCVCLELGEVA